MKKALIVLAVACALMAVVANPISAGGGKVRGDNGQGAVNQVQVQDPPPFQP